MYGSGEYAVAETPDRCIVELRSSSFSSLRIAESGTFVSGGVVLEQKMAGCTLYNISIKAPSRTTTKEDSTRWVGVAVEGEVFDKVMEECEETLYGRIVTGVTRQTLTRFICTNSTFEHSHRTDLPPPRIPPLFIPHRTLNTQCDNTTESQTSCSSSTRIVVQGISSYIQTLTFINSNFHSCTTSSSGGALYLDSATLTLTGSCFIECGATSTGSTKGGGAVAIYNQGSLFTISKCLFSSCSSSSLGGAIYIWTISSDNYVHSSISEVIFCHNSAANDSAGHDVYINVSKVSDYTSLFSSCITSNTHHVLHCHSQLCCETEYYC